MIKRSIRRWALEFEIVTKLRHGAEGGIHPPTVMLSRFSKLSFNRYLNKSIEIINLVSDMSRRYVDAVCSGKRNYSIEYHQFGFGNKVRNKFIFQRTLIKPKCNTWTVHTEQSFIYPYVLIMRKQRSQGEVILFSSRANFRRFDHYPFWRNYFLNLHRILEASFVM